jgi:hypothetical protein
MPQYGIERCTVNDCDPVCDGRWGRKKKKKKNCKRLKPSFYQTTRKTTNCCDGYLFSVFLRDLMWPVG